MLRVLSLVVRPTVARLLNRMTILSGRLSLTMPKMLLKAKGLKQSPLETEKLAEIALGPEPTITVLQLVPRTVPMSRIAVQLNLMFRLTSTGLELTMRIEGPLDPTSLPLLLHESQKHGARDLNLVV